MHFSFDHNVAIVWMAVVKLRTRILIVMVFVAVIPVGVTAWTTLRIHQRESDNQLSELRLKGAAFGAELSQVEVKGAVRAIAGLAQRSIDWPSLSDEERDGALWLLFGQLDDIAAVLIEDSDGTLIGPIAHLAPGGPNDDWGQHPEMSPKDLNALHDELSLGPRPGSDQRAAVTIGRPLALEIGAVLPISFSVPGREPGSSWRVGVGLSLTYLCTRSRGLASSHTVAYLLDPEGRRLCGDASALLEMGPVVPDAATMQEFRFESTDGSAYIAASAQNTLGWRAVVAQKVSVAEAPQREIRNRSLYWIALGLLGACAAAVILAGGIAKPIETLKEAVSEVEGGNYEKRITLASEGEIGALATAFNSMSAEIQRWDAQLHERVENRTRDLREAQEQLIETRKMAALASLSAGVAHEINNPLTGVLTLTQAMLRKARNGETVKDPVASLSSVEREVRRIAAIVAQMRSLDKATGDGFMDHSLPDIVDGVVQDFSKTAANAGVKLVVHHSENMPLMFGNAAQLSEAIAKVVNNGIQSMKDKGGDLTLRTRDADRQLLILEIQDTGCGIPDDELGKIFEPFFTTKSEWHGTGLGLSVAHQLIASHNGQIKVRSVVGEGTTITILLPVASKRSHLV